MGRHEAAPARVPPTDWFAEFPPVRPQNGSDSINRSFARPPYNLEPEPEVAADTTPPSIVGEPGSIEESIWGDPPDAIPPEVSPSPPIPEPIETVAPTPYQVARAASTPEDRPFLPIEKPKNKGGRPRKVKPEDGGVKPANPDGPRKSYARSEPIMPDFEGMTPRQKANAFFEANLLDFAITIWEVSTDPYAKASERKSAAQAALEFGRGKAGTEEQIKNEKANLLVPAVGGGAMKESLLSKHKIEGDLPESAMARMEEAGSNILDAEIGEESDDE